MKSPQSHRWPSKLPSFLLTIQTAAEAPSGAHYLEGPNVARPTITILSLLDMPKKRHRKDWPNLLISSVA